MNKLLILFSILITCVALADGNERGNGSDLPNESDSSAWFLGDSSVHYCIELSPKFGRELSDIKVDVNNAIQSWIKYIVDRKIDDGFQAPYTKPFAKIFIEDLKCAETTDLTFYFGVEPPKVQQEKTKYANPVAYAKRQSVFDGGAWTKGYVWFTNSRSIDAIFPDWSNGFQFKTILMHELGHVFGNSHIENTIMDADIGKKLKEDSFKISNNGFDGIHILYFANWSQIKYSGIIGHGTGKSEDYKVFEIVTGRKSKGKINGKIYATKTFEISLEMTDELGVVTIPIHIVPQSNAPIFSIKGALFKKAVNFSTVTMDYLGSIYYGDLTTPNGNKYAVMLTVNSEGIGPLQINFVQNEQILTLFQAGIN